MKNRIYHNFGKRTLDLLIAVPALVASLPILAVIAVLVRIWLGSPVLFRQQRPGRLGNPFLVYKFRTMTDSRDESGNLLADKERLPCFGRFLRSSSLDELPGLLNVLKGEMSLVGPRPLLEQYLDRYTPEQARRHDVRPGITGWAQVNGRNAVDWEPRLAMDVWYVENCSLWLDLRILFKTIAKVILKEGINATGEATMSKFTGTIVADASSRRVAVIGAGGHAKIVISTLRAAQIEVEVVYDDNRDLWGTNILGVSVTGPIERAAENPDRPAIIAIGAVAARRRIAQQLQVRWVTAIHPSSWVDPTAELGPGTIVCAGAVIQTDVRIGSHCVVNTSASVDHDCCVQDYSNLGPGSRLSGNVHIEPNSDVGAGCTVIPGVSIGSGAVVGAGAVVIRDVPSRVTVVGCPAEILTRRRVA